MLEMLCTQDQFIPILYTSKLDFSGLVLNCLLRRLCYMIIERSLGVGGESLELILALLLVVGVFVDTLATGGSGLLLSTGLLRRRRGLTTCVWCGHFGLFAS